MWGRSAVGTAPPATARGQRHVHIPPRAGAVPRPVVARAAAGALVLEPGDAGDRRVHRVVRHHLVPVHARRRQRQARRQVLLHAHVPVAYHGARDRAELVDEDVGRHLGARHPQRARGEHEVAVGCRGREAHAHRHRQGEQLQLGRHHDVRGLERHSVRGEPVDGAEECAHLCLVETHGRRRAAQRGVAANGHPRGVDLDVAGQRAQADVRGRYGHVVEAPADQLREHLSAHIDIHVSVGRDLQTRDDLVADRPLHDAAGDGLPREPRAHRQGDDREHGDQPGPPAAATTLRAGCRGIRRQHPLRRRVRKRLRGVLVAHVTSARERSHRGGPARFAAPDRSRR